MICFHILPLPTPNVNPISAFFGDVTPNMPELWDAAYADLYHTNYDAMS